MKPKKKIIDTNEIKKEYLDYTVEVYHNHDSIRSAARELNISPMKMRKILITAGEYENEMSMEVWQMRSSGMSIEEIAEAEGMTASNVYAYLPYEKIIYNLYEKSVNADKQARYRKSMESEALVDDELIAWLKAHPGIVADLRRRAGLSAPSTSK